MSITEFITHREEIEQIITETQNKYDSAVERLEKHKEKFSNALELLGKVKLEAWSNDMTVFLRYYEMIANVQANKIQVENSKAILKNLPAPEVLANIKVASTNAREVLKDGMLSLEAGALIGVAAYGGVSMFAKASTGAKIATLSGVAKTNATLSWLGGGSLKRGGLGVLGGKIALGGIVLTSVLLVGGVISAFKGKARLAEAKAKQAEIEQTIEQMETVITFLDEVSSIAKDYIAFLERLSNKFNIFLDKLKEIVNGNKISNSGKIDFNQLPEFEQKTIHLTWLLVQVYYACLAQQVVTQKGNLNSKAKHTLNNCIDQSKEITTEFEQIQIEREKIKNEIDLVNETFIKSVNNLDLCRDNMKQFLIKSGINQIEKWNANINLFIDSLQHFENVEVKKLFSIKKFGSNIGNTFDDIINISNSVNEIMTANSVQNYNEILINISLDGISTLKINDENQINISENSIWFENGCTSNRVLNIANKLPSNYITDFKEILNNITYKEDSNFVKDINDEAEKITNSVEEVAKEIQQLRNLEIKKVRMLKRVDKALSLYTNEVDDIYLSHKKEEAAIDYDELNQKEKMTIQIACNLAILHYEISDACMFENKNALVDERYIKNVIKSSKKELYMFKKETFKMNSDDINAANIYWQPKALKMVYINSLFMALFISLAIYQFIKGDLYGLTGIAAAIICFPLIFPINKFKESQLWLFRLLKLILACMLVIILEIVGLVI